MAKVRNGEAMEQERERVEGKSSSPLRRVIKRNAIFSMNKFFVLHRKSKQKIHCNCRFHRSIHPEMMMLMQGEAERAEDGGDKEGGEREMKKE